MGCSAAPPTKEIIKKNKEKTNEEVEEEEDDDNDYLYVREKNQALVKDVKKKSAVTFIGILKGQKKAKMKAGEVISSMTLKGEMSLNHKIPLKYDLNGDLNLLGTNTDLIPSYLEWVILAVLKKGRFSKLQGIINSEFQNVNYGDLTGQLDGTVHFDEKVISKLPPNIHFRLNASYSETEEFSIFGEYLVKRKGEQELVPEEEEVEDNDEDIYLDEYRSYQENLDVSLELEKSLVGLSGLNDSSYIISIIQILAHLRSFIYYLVSFAKKILNLKSTMTSRKLYETFIKMSFKKAFEVLHPVDFILSFLKRHMELPDEKNSQIFLSAVLEDIHTELNRRRKKEFETKEFIGDEDKEGDLDKMLTEYSQQNDSIITDIFGLVIYNEYECSCGNIFYRLTNHFLLELFFDNETKDFMTINLMDLLKLKFHQKNKSYMLQKCTKCQKSSYVNSSQKIAKIPQILILFIRRDILLGDKKVKDKISVKLKFEEELDILDSTDPEIFSKLISELIFYI